MSNNLPKRFELEKMKLAAEIDAIKHPYYKRAEFYASISPIVLGILGVLFSWWSGFFDAKNDALDAKRTLLENDVRLLEWDKIQLDSTYRVKGDSLKRLFTLQIAQLDSEYRSKERDLNKSYATRIDSVDKTAQLSKKNSDQMIQSLKIKDIGTQNYIRKLNDDISAYSSLNNELKKESQSFADSLLSTQSTLKQTSYNMGVMRSELRYSEAKGKILAYLVVNGWLRMGYNRIRAEIDSSYDDAFLDALISKNNKIFEKVILTDDSDVNGLSIVK